MSFSTLKWRDTIGAKLAAVVFSMFLLALSLALANYFLLSSLAGHTRWLNHAGNQRLHLLQMLRFSSQIQPSSSPQTQRAQEKLRHHMRLFSENLQSLSRSAICPPHALRTLKQRWQGELRPLFKSQLRLSSAPPKQLLGYSSTFIHALDTLITRFQANLDHRLGRYQLLQLLFVAIAFGVFLFVSWLGHHHFYLRIHKLSLDADKIADGQLDLNLQSHGKDEIAMLSNSFNRMTQRIHLQLQDLSSQYAKTHAILNATPDPIITIDEKGIITSCNKATTKVFGHESPVGQNVSLLMPSPEREEHDGYIQRYLDTQEARIMKQEREVVGLRHNGQTFPLSLWVSEMRHEQERMFIGVVRDITRAKRQQAQREQVFSTITHTMARLATAGEEILAAGTQLASTTHEQATAVHQTVSTVVQVSQTARQAAERAAHVADYALASETIGKEGQQQIKTSVSTMHSAKQDADTTAHSILKLTEQAQAIGEIISTVKEIAEQTNLLALNAAIEAARAGEHGKGFGVVADEVKLLASDAKKATAQVRNILLDIQQATSSAVLTTDSGTRSLTLAVERISETGHTINQLSGMLSSAADTAQQISASAHQQANGMDQINLAMQQVDQATQQTVTAAQQLERAARDLNALAEELRELLDGWLH